MSGKLSRRGLLKLGGGVAVVAATGLSYRIWDTGVAAGAGAAFDPWHSWEKAPRGSVESVAAAAILASNPHNTQPWIMALGSDFIDLYADPARNLGAFDVYRRELWTGLGCAITNMEIGATAKGFSTEVVLTPDASQPNWAAHIALSRSSVTEHELAAVITERRTNRTAYILDEPVTVAAASRLVIHAGTRVVWLEAGDTRHNAFKKATLEATRTINADAQMVRDGHRWFRANPRAVEKYRDGVTLPTAGLSPLIANLAGPMMPEADGAKAGNYWLASTTKQLDSAPVFGLIAVEDLYATASCLNAGRAWQALHLELTAAGYAAQPMNQLMEVADRDRELGRGTGTRDLLDALLAQPGYQATFAFRAGRARAEVPHSPRRAVADVVRPANPA